MTFNHGQAKRRTATAHGVSLIEALVAMAVMAFGMLAVIGVQTTFRINADVAKQRSEATRIAEEEIERLRAFKQIDAVVPPVPGAFGWDEVVAQLGSQLNLTGGNATFTLNRRVADIPGSAQKAVMVEVTWTDRLGNTQSVVLGDTLAGASPVLSGLLSVPATRSAASQRGNRHPTIPVRAHDLGDGRSAFKPVEGGTIAWTFSNTTGVITNVCTVSAVSTSSSLTAGDLTTCTATTAQLLAGAIRFNLRGASKDFGNGTSAFKPVAGGTVAWVIDNGLSRIIRNCQVTAGSTTASLLAADVIGASCTVLGTPQPVAPYDAVNDPSYAMLAVDSEDPRWPALPVGIDLTLTSTLHSSGPLCFADAPGDSVSANGQYAAEYFCIVYPNTQHTWSGSSTLAPGAFGDGGAVTWSTGITTDTYRVCRYTQALGNTTTNTDHPLAYSNVSGNLINQNFLVVAGQKTCPTDVVANPASGDFVNSNTLQHQP